MFVQDWKVNSVKRGAKAVRSLADYLSDEPADTAKTLEILSCLAEKLIRIHKSGLRHAPLCPQNIWLNSEGEPEVESTPLPRWEEETTYIPNFKYSAPEAFRESTSSGSCEAADIYVLGMIFYELFLGRRLFSQQFGYLDHSPLTAWLQWHGNVTLRAESLAKFSLNLPTSVTQLVDRMMEKDPAKRVDSLVKVAGNFDFEDTKIPKLSLVESSPRSLTKTESRREKAEDEPPPRGRKTHSKLAIILFFVLGASVGPVVLLRSPKVMTVLKNVLGSAKAQLPERSSELSQPIDRVVSTYPQAATKTPHAILRLRSTLKGIRIRLDDEPLSELERYDPFEHQLAPGSHTLYAVGGDRASVSLRFRVQPDASLTLIEPVTASNIRCTVVVANKNQKRLFDYPKSDANLTNSSNSDDGGSKFLRSPTSQVPSIAILLRKGILQVTPVPVELNSDFSNEPPAADKGKLPQQLRPLPPEASKTVRTEPAVKNSGVNSPLPAPSPGNPPLLPTVSMSALLIDSMAASVEILLDGASFGTTDANGSFKAKVSPGRHVLTFRKPHFEDLVTSRDFAAGSTLAIKEAALKPFGHIVFQVQPSSARITCIRKYGSEKNDCPNNQSCYLPEGSYDVTVQADKFNQRTYSLGIRSGENNPIAMELEPAASVTRSVATPAKQVISGPGDIFENASEWHVNRSGEWVYTQRGISFAKNNQGTFVFDVKRGNTFSFVVNYRNENNRILYTLDETTLRRNIRAPGVKTPDTTIPLGPLWDPSLRLTVQLLADRIVLRSGTGGRVLDDFPLVNPSEGKFGLVGRMSLHFAQQ